MDASMAQKTWEMSNNVETVGCVDEIYRFGKKQDVMRFEALNMVN